jgi:hypothetical protein
MLEGIKNEVMGSRSKETAQMKPQESTVLEKYELGFFFY